MPRPTVTAKVRQRAALARFHPKVFVHLLLVVVPWRVRRVLLTRVFGFEIHPSAHIGRSIVAPSYLEMGPGATIGHFNVIRGMDRLVMERGAGISHLNWVYGVPGDAPYFPHQPARRSHLIIEEGGGFTSRHLVDCTDTVRIARYAMVAGYGVQILTHSVDMATNRQTARPVSIGAYSMVGTRSVLIGGATLPDYSALGAGSVLRNVFTDTHGIFSGVPATRVGTIPADAAYFAHSTSGVPGHRLASP